MAFFYKLNLSAPVPQRTFVADTFQRQQEFRSTGMWGKESDSGIGGTGIRVASGIGGTGIHFASGIRGTGIHFASGIGGTGIDNGITSTSISSRLADAKKAGMDAPQVAQLQTPFSWGAPARTAAPGDVSQRLNELRIIEAAWGVSGLKLSFV